MALVLTCTMYYTGTILIIILRLIIIIVIIIPFCACDHNLDLHARYYFN